MNGIANVMGAARSDGLVIERDDTQVLLGGDPQAQARFTLPLVSRKPEVLEQLRTEELGRAAVDLLGALGFEVTYFGAVPSLTGRNLPLETACGRSVRRVFEGLTPAINAFADRARAETRGRVMVGEREIAAAARADAA